MDIEWKDPNYLKLVEEYERRCAEDPRSCNSVSYAFIAICAFVGTGFFAFLVWMFFWWQDKREKKEDPESQQESLEARVLRVMLNMDHEPDNGEDIQLRPLSQEIAVPPPAHMSPDASNDVNTQPRLNQVQPENEWMKEQLTGGVGRAL